MKPFTEEWALAFCAAINASVAYRESAQRWTWPLALVLEAAPELGYAQDVAILLQLDKGHCHNTSVHAADTVAAPFVLRGDYAAWKAILKGELDPTVAITRKRLNLQGSLATIMLNARSAKILVACASTVATTFPDEHDIQ